MKPGEGVVSYSRSRRLTDFAGFTALSVMFYILEAVFIPPFPVPGVKLGLANLPALLVLDFLGPGACLLVTFLRVAIGGLLSGTVFTPAFVISMFSGMLASLVMVGLYVVFTEKLSLIGISVAGAFMFNIAQLAAASVVVSSPAVFVFTPVLLLAGTFTGWLNGFLAQLAVERIRVFWDNT